MEKTLNTANIQSAMEKAGLSQTRLAEQLDVSKEIVSKWLSGKKFPRPRLLLELALALDLKFDDLVIKTLAVDEPVIAFRKKGNAKTTKAHIKKAKEMGFMLSPLVPHLPYDKLIQPAALKNPRNEYAYIQEVASKVRKDIGLDIDKVLDFTHLIRRFNDLQAVIIPVLWGKKDRHENALHIYLPLSMTTWVYLNLDAEYHDFKFWMAHELGHVYAPELRGEEAEDFADAFAGALLYPQVLAEQTYYDLIAERSNRKQIEMIRSKAEEYSISMISILYEVNKFAVENNKVEIKLGDHLFKANTNFNKNYRAVSQLLFPDGPPDAAEYIKKSTEIFDTPFFSALNSYLVENGKSAGYIQCILDTPLLDAKELHAELS